MLDRFSVKDFKSLVDVSIELGTVNVFIGANGSGKSNFLEAIGVLGAAASGRVNDETLKYRGVRPGVPALYKASFKSKKVAQHIAFVAKGSDSTYSATLYNPIDEPTADWQFKHESWLRGNKSIVGRSPNSYAQLNKYAGLAALESVKLPVEDQASQLLELLRNYAIYAPDTPTLRGLESDSHQREPVGLAGGKLPEGVQSVRIAHPHQVANLFPLVKWLSAFNVSYTSQLPIAASVPQQQRGLRFRDRYMVEGRDILSGYDASEGVLYILFCTVLALHSKTPKLFAIDNFDQALNPRTARDFTRLFCQWLLEANDRQAILTTHNPLVLDGLPLQNDKVRLFAVDRSFMGHTIIRRVEINEKLLKAAESGTPLSQQWVNGYFGGVPSGV